MGSFSIIPQTIVALEDINNVNVTPTGGQVLFYDATAAQWKQRSSVPIGSILAWHKTFGLADSGADDAGAAGKLTQAGQNFLTTVTAGMVIFNSTTLLFSTVTAVDSDTVLSISPDIMNIGDGYGIYKTPTLPDGWLECDGSAITDVDSPYNGETLPALNGLTDADKFFIRGVKEATTGTTSAPSHTHSFNDNANYAAGGGGGSSGPRTTSGDLSIAPNAEMVFIMRIK
jgi:hypothetical protein